MTIGKALIPFIFDLSENEVKAIYEQPSLYSGPIKFVQLFNGIGLFIVPSIIYLSIFNKELIRTSLLVSPCPFSIILTTLIFFCSMAFVTQLAQWNEALELPQVFSNIEGTIKEMEEKASELTIALLHMENYSQLLFNLLLIALIPALGEELVFRGIIQNTINDGLNNKHIGIWIAAILFSAIHMQFYGFLPRMFLGALFGYLLLWSKNLWIPIFAHFLNNGIAVFASYKGDIEVLKESLVHEDSKLSPIFSLFSFILFFLLLFIFRRLQNHSITKI